jgi:hypothetical protein
MSYYMGDYRGDYYVGDPGIGSFFKGIAQTAIGFIPGIGPLASRAIGAIGRHAPAAGAITGAVRTAAARTGAAIVKHPVLSAAGAAGALGAGEMMVTSRGATTLVPGAKGMHMSKARRGHPAHMVRNRRMNVANGRALARATRRLHAFARRYRKVVGFVSPRRPKGRIYFKKRHRRAA